MNESFIGNSCCCLGLFLPVYLSSVIFHQSLGEILYNSNALPLITFPLGIAVCKLSLYVLFELSFLCFPLKKWTSGRSDCSFTTQNAVFL